MRFEKIGDLGYLKFQAQMPNNTALAIYFGDILKDQSHPRDGILFYSNAGKNITELDDETAENQKKSGKTP